MSSRNLPSEILYISLDVVLEIHKRQLQTYGGSDGIRNESGLKSAVEKFLPIVHRSSARFQTQSHSSVVDEPRSWRASSAPMLCTPASCLTGVLARFTPHAIA
ncbi:MAG: hypothetical protein SGJ18_06990 [Pseudomonadota bacterium]|nr:hypothetical protein [Pseudomonadota bacterium]